MASGGPAPLARMYREQLCRRARSVGTVGLLPKLNGCSFETEEYSQKDGLAYGRTTRLPGQGRLGSLCGLVAPFNMPSRSRASMSLTPAAVTLPSAEAIAVARSAAYVCAAGMNSAHAAHTYVRCARACCGGHAM